MIFLCRFLTDLELACKTKSFDVHKLVISSISQYFREILAKDPGMKRLELPSLSPLGTTLNFTVKVPFMLSQVAFYASCPQPRGFFLSARLPKIR